MKAFKCWLSNQVHGSDTNSNKSHHSVKNAEVVGGKKAPKEGETSSKSATTERSNKEKRGKSLREVTTKRAALVRSSTDFRPATNKGLNNNSSVSPAASRVPHKLQKRYTFKNQIPPLKSGESTDSVNSILSDAKSNSDLNLNRVSAEENGNFGIGSSRDVDDKSDVLSSISQASSGVTSCIAGKLTAKTRQLPQPVRPSTFVRPAPPSSIAACTSSGADVNLGHKYRSSRHNNNAPNKSSQNPVAVHVSSSLEGSAVRSNHDTEFGLDTSPAPKLSLRSVEHVTSSRYTISKDPALRSISDTDKKEICKSAIPGTSKGPLRLSKEDVSDAWLREKKTDMKMKLESKPSISISQKGAQEPKPKEDSSGKEVGKEKRDNSTYSAARQKIAPYSRSRISYQTSSMRTSEAPVNPIFKKSNSGVVHSRVAELEKFPKLCGKSTKAVEAPTKEIVPPKKLMVRPTLFEKLPSMPHTTETIELSKPLLRKLQYTEGKKTCLSTGGISPSNQANGDVLVVSSVQRKSDLASSNGENSEEKHVNDEKQTEKSVKQKSNEVKANEKLRHVGSSKLVQPQKIATHKTIPTLMPTRNQITSSKICPPKAENSAKDLGRSKSCPHPASLIKEQSVSPHKVMNASKKVGHSNQSGDKNIKITCQRNDPNPNINIYSGKKFEEDSNTKTKPTNTDRIVEAKIKDESATNPSKAPNSKPNVVVSNMRTTSTVEKKQPTRKATLDALSNLSSSSNVMTSSTESTTKSTSSLGLSGKCTPTMGGHKAEIDQDFFIEDEISDQPGLMFGDAVDLSFLEEEDLFEEDVSSPSHMALQEVRSRAESAATISSIGEDLILDYDTDDAKNSCSRLESDLLSPTVGEVDNSPAVLVKEDSPSHRCVSKEGLDTILVSESASVNTRQPVGNGLPSSFNESPLPTSDVCYQRQVDQIDPDCVVLNRATAQFIYQDVAAIKSLLLRLRKILISSDGINPLNGETKAALYLNLGINDSPLKKGALSDDLTAENLDLKRQVILLQQQMEEKNKTINVLSQQLTQARQLSKPLSSSQVSSTVMTPGMMTLSPMTSSSCSDSSQSSNAATQTDRSNYKHCDLGLSRTTSVEDGLGPTVSFSGNIPKQSPDRDRVRSEIRRPNNSTRPETHCPSNSIANQHSPSEVLLNL